jgi:hypothetical protein
LYKSVIIGLLVPLNEGIGVWFSPLLLGEDGVRIERQGEFRNQSKCKNTFHYRALTRNVRNLEKVREISIKGHIKKVIMS